MRDQERESERESVRDRARERSREETKPSVEHRDGRLRKKKLKRNSTDREVAPPGDTFAKKIHG